MTTLEIDKWEEAIRAFNGDAETLAGDRLIFRHFGPAADDSLTIAERVVLLDMVWGTLMAYRKPKHVGRVIRSIQRHESEIIQACQSIQPDALETAPGDVIAVVHRLLPIVMGHADGDTGGYTPYSFATKYLHWTTCRHFPIMDRRARGAICRLTHDKSDWPCIETESPGPEDYPLWIEFYSRLIRSLEPDHRERLIATDYNSQPDGLRCMNTLLRILDKVFYWLGDEGEVGPSAD